MTGKSATEVATLAGGCFWCLEAIFREVKGVNEVIPGYTGGTTPHPTYEQVCSGHTGHAEAVRITFDTSLISYRDILEIFFSIHDPTTLNRQGADLGTQYRSAIFYHDARQQATARELIARLEKDKIWNKPIVTQIVQSDIFYPAENYHREYFLKHPEQMYCQVVISPKLGKFRKQWKSQLI